MTDEEVTESVKKMLDEPITQCNKTELAPFYTSNKPPAVRSLPFLPVLIRLLFNIVLITLCLILQANDAFWKRKASNKPMRDARAKSKVTKKEAKKKTAESSDPPEDVDESDPEVELDSLGSFFIHLIDNDYSQDDAEASRADHVEVISLSSDSDLVPDQKICREVRKVKYSHPLAPLDPQFSLMTQQIEGRRTTRL